MSGIDLTMTCIGEIQHNIHARCVFFRVFHANYMYLTLRQLQSRPVYIILSSFVLNRYIALSLSIDIVCVHHKYLLSICFNLGMLHSCVCVCAPV